MEHAVQANRLGEALEAAAAILELGDKPPRDLLQGLLQSAAASGTLELYANTLGCCSPSEFEIDIDGYARLLGSLMSRQASQVQIRATLNMALCKGSELIPLLPRDATAEEIRAAFESGQLAGEGEAQEGEPAAEAKEAGQEDLKAMMAFSRLDLVGLQGMVRQRDRPAQVAYFCHFAVLLHLERLAELQGYLRRMQQHVGQELARLGWALLDLEARGTYGRSDSRRVLLPGWPDEGTEVVAFGMPPGTDLDRLRFRRGDTVLLSRGDPLRSCVGAGTLLDIDRKKIVVSLACKVPVGAPGSRWRLDAFANQVAYERQFAAVLQLARAEKPEPICELLVAGGGVQPGQPANADQLLGLALEEPGMEVASRLADARDEVCSLPGVNGSQCVAIEDALGRRCTVVQGPPGTGKTHVAVRTLQLWSQRVRLSPVLAASDSNVAVDNIADGLAKAGVRVVRVGRCEKVRGHLESMTLEFLLAKDQARRAEEEQARRAEEVAEGTGDGECMVARTGEPSSPPHLETSEQQTLEQQLKAEFANKRKKSREDYFAQMRILQCAEVICATTNGAGGEILANFSFKAALIDEVAQATEPSSIVPVVLRGARQLVLMGDHCQLPPAVNSREAEARGLSRSVFARLADAGLEPHFLDTQYRSHPCLAQFSALRFYGGRLRSGVPAASRPLPRGVPWPNPAAPVAFIEVDSGEIAEGSSKANVGEAQRVLGVLVAVLEAGELGLGDIGVVTPYSAQARILRRLLHGRLGGARGQGNELEIASVDSFQGREKELIVFSAVRSNPTGSVGFLADWRRLNVMLTRARRGLVVVGSATTLVHDHHWREWFGWYQDTVSPLSRV